MTASRSQKPQSSSNRRNFAKGSGNYLFPVGSFISVGISATAYNVANAAVTRSSILGTGSSTVSYALPTTSNQPTVSGVVAPYGYGTSTGSYTSPNATINFTGNYDFFPGASQISGNSPAPDAQAAVTHATPSGYNVGGATPVAPGIGAPTGSSVTYPPGGTPSGGVTIPPGVVTVVPLTGVAWNENNPIRVIGDGPVQTCWKFSPPPPAPGTTNAGLFALAQPTITMLPTTARDQNAGIEIANILFIGPQNFNDSSCAIGIDNTTAPYIHDNWFQGWVGDPGGNTSGTGNQTIGNSVGGCGIEIFANQKGGSLGANIDRNRFGFQKFQVLNGFTNYSLTDMAVTGMRHGVWLNGPYNYDGKDNDINMMANRFEAFMVGGVRVAGFGLSTWTAPSAGSALDLTSEKNKYYSYISHSMENNTLNTAANATDMTFDTNTADFNYSGSQLAGLVARIVMSNGVSEGAYITAAKTTGSREVLVFSANGQLQSGTSSPAVTLAPGSATSDGFYNGSTILMTSGTCVGYSGAVTGYSGSSSAATVPFPGCSGYPAAMDYYTITPGWMLGPTAASGTLAGSTSTTVQLPATASIFNSDYVSDTLTVTTGTCTGDTGTITAYTAATQTATVSLYGCGSGPGAAGFTITPPQPVGTAFAAYGQPAAVVASSSTTPTATVTLATGTTGSYTNSILAMLTGTCAGKSAIITNYTGSLAASVMLPPSSGSSLLSCTPGTSDQYAITPPLNVSYSGTLTSFTSGTPASLTFQSTAWSSPSSIANYYASAIITMAAGGHCPGASGQITASSFSGSTLTATVAWAGACVPNPSDPFVITPSASPSYSGVFTGTPTSTTVTLAPGASWANGFYASSTITDATPSSSCYKGSGVISNYVGYNLQATVSFANGSGACTPAAGDTYAVTPSWWVAPVVPATGTVVAATSTQITLQSTASAISGYYNNASLTITNSGSACYNKTGTISSYNGSTQVATVSLGCVPTAGTDTYAVNSNYELGYADFGARAEWPHPAVIGHGTYYAQQAKYHSRGDYFENAIMLVGSGSSTNCTLSSIPAYCPAPTARPTIEFDQVENEVTRGRSTMYEDESFLMPGGLKSLYPNASGQVGSHAVLGSLTLADPQLMSNAAPLMTVCLNATGHTLNVGDVVALQTGGGGAGYNNCIDPASYPTSGGASNTPVEYPCFIITAPASSTVTSFANGQPATIAMPGSQVMVSVSAANTNGIHSGAILVAVAPSLSGGAITQNGSVQGFDPGTSSTGFQAVAQACAYAIGTTNSHPPIPTLIRAIARW
jgi:hypothetical protein